MIDEGRNEYFPDQASPPGETLRETLELTAMSQEELSKRTGRSRRIINEIVNGKAAITSEVALQLERALGIPASFWNNREHYYREALARAEERKRLGSQTGWLDRIPVKEMTRFGWIRKLKDEVAQLREVLNFFGVASPKEGDRLLSSMRVSYRRSAAFEADPGAVAAWLRKGWIDAQEIECRPFDRRTFRSALPQIRSLTREVPEVFAPKMVGLCADAGVALVFVPQLPKTRTSGATQWLSPDRGLIQLSLRGRVNDRLWFTFFHEAGHLLLHGKRDAFIDIEGEVTDDAQEREADKFSADTLIPPGKFERLCSCPDGPSLAIVTRFARELGIARGIVVGRLQHEGIFPYNRGNRLKVRLRWANE